MRAIDANKFIDKLLHMGYMDEQKSEVEEVANNMIVEAFTREEVATMFEQVKAEIENTPTADLGETFVRNNCRDIVQYTIDTLRGDEIAARIEK